MGLSQDHIAFFFFIKRENGLFGLNLLGLQHQVLSFLYYYLN